MPQLPRRTLGKTGLAVTTLGYGAMELRGAPRGPEISDAEAERILNAVLDSGINFIDTSIDYGRSEELIGKFISSRRGEYYLASKCGCVVGAPGGSDHVHTAENIRTGVGGTRLLRAWEDPAAAVHAKPGEDGYRYFFQNGPQVYRDVLPTVDVASRDLLSRHGLAPEDVARWWVHQASLPMIDGIFQRILGKRPTPDLVPLVLDRLGNTSSCGAAYCLAEDPGLAPGQYGMLLAFGGGYTVGAALVRGT